MFSECMDETRVFSAYPLGLQNYDPRTSDGQTIKNRLEADHSRLLDSKTNVEVLRIAYAKVDRNSLTETQTHTDSRSRYEVTNLKLNTNGKFIEYCDWAPQEYSAFQFIFIRPKFSYGKLPISLPDLRRLLYTFSVIPEFAQIIHTFGQKTREKGEDFGTYKQRIQTSYPLLPHGNNRSASDSGRVVHLCYSLRYVEQREKNVWSTRKFGVYCKMNSNPMKTVWILVNVPKSFQEERLKEIFTSNHTCYDEPHKEVIYAFDVHSLLLQTASQNWTGYISYLQTLFTDLNEKATLDAFKLEIEDTLGLHKLKDKVLQLVQFLEGNISVLKSMRRGMWKIAQLEKSEVDGDENFYQNMEIIESQIMDLRQQRGRAKSLIRRADAIETLIPYILSRRESAVASEHSRSIKIITVVTFLYLPSTLTTGFFGCQFIHWDPGHKIQFAPETGYFVLSTVVLMALTYGIWILWEKRYRAKKEKKLQEDVELGECNRPALSILRPRLLTRRI